MAAPDETIVHKKNRWNPFKNWRVTLIVGGCIVVAVVLISVVASSGNCDLVISATGIRQNCQNGDAQKQAH